MSIQKAYLAVIARIRSVVALVLDMMEYSTDSAAQTAYVTSATAYTAQYPPAQSDTYVKATSEAPQAVAYMVTDPTTSLTGVTTGNAWQTLSPNDANMRFHIDLGSSKIINRIYYENAHGNTTIGGTNTGRGVNNFILQGSNTGAGTFDDLVYANDGGWTEITGLSQNTMDEHSEADEADPKYITITGNTTPYRYYAIKISDNHGEANYMGLRRIELQTADLIALSEPTIKTEGSYALKLSATTDALGETVVKTLTGGDILDLTGKNTIKFDVRSTGTGSNLQASIHDSGGTTSTHTVNILSADTYQTESWDISAISNANKDAIDSIDFEILNAGSARTFYIDNFYAE